MLIFVHLGFSLLLNNPFLGVELLGMCTLNSERYHQIELSSGYSHACSINHPCMENTHSPKHGCGPNYCKPNPKPSASMVTSFAFLRSLPKLNASSMLIIHLYYFCELPFRILCSLYFFSYQFKKFLVNWGYYLWYKYFFPV